MSYASSRQTRKEMGSTTVGWREIGFRGFGGQRWDRFHENIRILRLYDTLSETREQVPDGWKGRFCHNLSIASLRGVDHPSTVFWWNIDSFSGYGSLYFLRPFFVKESMIRRNSFSDVKWSVDLEKTLFEVGHHWRNRWKSRKMMFFCHLEKKYH